MSRFNNPKALETAEPRANGRPGRAPLWKKPSVDAGDAPAATAPARVAPPPLPLLRFGLFCFCLYWVSGPLNQLTFHVIHSKAYVSLLVVYAMPLVWLLTGNPFAGLRHKVGRYWAGIMVLMLASTVLSIWRTGSISVMVDYIGHCYLLFFYITSFICTISQLKKLLYVTVGIDFFTLFLCMKFGGVDAAGRFSIRYDIYYANSNDLALALLVAITQFMFLMYAGGNGKKLLACAGIVLSMIYILKTGSRGCALAGLILVIIAFCFSKKKAAFALIAIGAVAAGLVLAPSAARQRLLAIALTSSSDLSEQELGAARASQESREQLLRRSIVVSFTHPLLGVGPGMFAVEENDYWKSIGQHTAWLGTHNTYTQISSECGIPALILYLGVVFTCIRASFRAYKRTRNDPNAKDAAGLSFCVFCGLLVYSVAIFFFHIGYAPGMPFLSGMAVVLDRLVNVPAHNLAQVQRPPSPPLGLKRPAVAV